jgi:YD repeat-containing protein
MHLDSLGRDVLGIEHNIVNGADEFYATFTKLDIEGNIRHIEDARHNLVMQYKYDMLGHGLYQESTDAGERWSLNNVLGKPLKTWDSRNHIFYFTYDALNRPLESKVTGGDGPSPLNHVFSKAIYGEGAANDKLNNLRGKILVLYDTAGKVETTQYDAKGNLLATTRRFATNYKDTVDWSINPDAKLENEAHTSTAEYDAIKRVTRQTFPDGSIVEPGYNEMSLLENFQVTQNGNSEIFVKEINYNEKGQRVKIIYGNDVTTNYFYDRKSFRLLRLENKKLNNDSLQDYYYTYDPSGNITHIQDKNIPAVFFNNQKIDAVNSFTYDAVYRLSEANGREHAASLSFGTGGQLE